MTPEEYDKALLEQGPRVSDTLEQKLMSPAEYDEATGLTQQGKTQLSDQQVDHQRMLDSRGLLDEFGVGAVRGYHGLMGTVDATAGLIGKLVGAEPLEKWGMQGYTEHMEEAAKNQAAIQDPLTDIHGFGDGAKFFAGMLGDNLPSLAAFAGGASIGTFAARKLASALVARAAGQELAAMTAEGLTEGLTTEAAQKLAGQRAVEKMASNLGANGVEGAKKWVDLAGSQIGMTPANLTGSVGGLTGEIYDKTGQVDPGTALAYGLPAAALMNIQGGVEAAPFMKGLHPAQGVAAPLLSKQWGINTAKQIGTSATSLGALGRGQTWLEQLGLYAADPNEDPNTEEKAHARNLATFSGGLLGATMGLGGQVFAGTIGTLRAKGAPLTAEALAAKLRNKQAEVVPGKVPSVIDISGDGVTPAPNTRSDTILNPRIKKVDDGHYSVRTASGNATIKLPADQDAKALETATLLAEGADSIDDKFLKSQAQSTTDPKVLLTDTLPQGGDSKGEVQTQNGGKEKVTPEPSVTFTGLEDKTPEELDAAHKQLMDDVVSLKDLQQKKDALAAIKLINDEKVRRAAIVAAPETPPVADASEANDIYYENYVPGENSIFRGTPSLEGNGELPDMTSIFHLTPSLGEADSALGGTESIFSGTPSLNGGKKDNKSIFKGTPKLFGDKKSIFKGTPGVEESLTGSFEPTKPAPVSVPEPKPTTDVLPKPTDPVAEGGGSNGKVQTQNGGKEKVAFTPEFAQSVEERLRKLSPADALAPDFDWADVGTNPGLQALLESQHALLQKVGGFENVPADAPSEKRNAPGQSDPSARPGTGTNEPLQPRGPLPVEDKFSRDSLKADLEKPDGETNADGDRIVKVTPEEEDTLNLHPDEFHFRAYPEGGGELSLAGSLDERTSSQKRKASEAAFEREAKKQGRENIANAEDLRPNELSDDWAEKHGLTEGGKYSQPAPNEDKKVALAFKRLEKFFLMGGSKEGQPSMADNILGMSDNRKDLAEEHTRNLIAAGVRKYQLELRKGKAGDPSTSAIGDSLFLDLARAVEGRRKKLGEKAAIRGVEDDFADHIPASEKHSELDTLDEEESIDYLNARKDSKKVPLNDLLKDRIDKVTAAYEDNKTLTEEEQNEVRDIAKKIAELDADASSRNGSAGKTEPRDSKLPIGQPNAPAPQPETGGLRKAGSGGNKSGGNGKSDSGSGRPVGGGKSPAKSPDVRPPDAGATGGSGDQQRGGPAGTRPRTIILGQEFLGETGANKRVDTQPRGPGRVQLDKNQSDAANVMLRSFLDLKRRVFGLFMGTGEGKSITLLASADQYAKETGKKVGLVVLNKGILDRFQQDAKAMGVDFSKFEVLTYKSLGDGAEFSPGVGMVILDESHAVKNADSLRAIAASKISADHIVLSTATPMDSFVSGAKSLSQILPHLTEDDIFHRIGVAKKPLTGKDGTLVLDKNNEPVFTTVLTEGHSWKSATEELLKLRDEALKQGTMYRSFTPFFGEIRTETDKLTEEQHAQQSRVIEHYQNEMDDASWNKRRNLAGQLTLELGRLAEMHKREWTLRRIKEELAEGRSPIVIAETAGTQTFKGLDNEQHRGLLSWLGDKLREEGIDFAEIYGENQNKKVREGDRFQKGEVRVALGTPASAGVGINLDDSIGHAPRSLILPSVNFSGDVFDQTLGRVSRRNTKSEARVSFLTHRDSVSDQRRAETMEKKLGVLRAIQGGTDADVAMLKDSVDQPAPKQSSKKLRATAPSWFQQDAAGQLDYFRKQLGEMRLQEALASKNPGKVLEPHMREWRNQHPFPAYEGGKLRSLSAGTKPAQATGTGITPKAAGELFKALSRCAVKFDTSKTGDNGVASIQFDRGVPKEILVNPRELARSTSWMTTPERVAFVAKLVIHEGAHIGVIERISEELNDLLGREATNTELEERVLQVAREGYDRLMATEKGREMLKEARDLYPGELSDEQAYLELHRMKAQRVMDGETNEEFFNRILNGGDASLIAWVRRILDGMRRMLSRVPSLREAVEKAEADLNAAMGEKKANTSGGSVQGNILSAKAPKEKPLYEGEGLFAPGGKFNTATRQRLRSMEAAKREAVEHASGGVRKLARALDTDFKGRDVPVETLNTAFGNPDNHLTDEQYSKYQEIKATSPEKADEYFTAAQDLNREQYKVRQAAAMASLPEATREAMQYLRDSVDRLSDHGIDTKAFQGTLAETVAKNRGTYQHRGYAIFKDQKWADTFKTSTDPEIMQRRADMEAYMRNLAIVQRTNEIMLADKSITKADAQNIAVADPKTADLAGNLFESYMGIGKEGMTALVTGRLPGQQNLSITKLRGQIPEVVRKAWGEYKDPIANFVNTYTGVASFVANHEFLSNIRDIGIKEGWIHDPTAGAHPTGWGQFAGDRKNMGPLHGLYGTPELVEAFKEYADQHHKLDWFTRSISAMTGFASLSKTALSVQSGARNFMGNMIPSIANGNFFNVVMQPSILRDARGIAFSNKEKYQIKKEAAIRLGLKGQGVEAIMTQQLINRGLGKNDDGNSFIHAVKGAIGKMTDVYGGMDDFWKVINHRGELQKIQKLTPDQVFSEAARKGIDLRGVKPEDFHDIYAAEIVRNTTPTYDLAWDINKKVFKKIPFFGPFLTFTLETIRTVKNIGQYALTEIHSPIPEVRKAGYARMAGLSMAMLGPSAASAAAGGMLGMGQEDDDALREHLPPWLKNAMILPIKKENGKVTYLDISFFDMYAQMFKEPSIALMRSIHRKEALGEPVGVVEPAVAFLGQLLEPFVNEQIFSSSVIDVLRNTNKDGRPIFNPYDPARYAQGMAHIAEAFVPGTVDSMVRMGKAYTGFAEKSSGRTYDPVIETLAPFVGFRPAVVDLENSLGYATYKYTQEKGKASEILNRELRSRGSTSPEEIQSAYQKAAAARDQVDDDMRMKYLSAVKLGVSPQRAARILHEGHIPPRDSREITSGNFADFKASRSMLRKLPADRAQAYREAEKVLAGK